MQDLLGKRAARILWGAFFLFCAVLIGLIYLGVHAGWTDPTPGNSPAP